MRVGKCIRCGSFPWLPPFAQSGVIITFMSVDPNAPSVADPHGGEGSFISGLVSAAAMQQLAATRPWVRSLSVMVFIGAASMLLDAFTLFMQGVTMDKAVMLKVSQGHPVLGVLGFNGLAGVNVVFAFILIFPALKLWKYASSISSLLKTGSEEDLVAALNQQRSFWKFAGIMVIIMLVIYLLIIVGVAVAAGVAAASHAH